MQAWAAKRLANKEKAEEEKARKEDNVQQTKEAMNLWWKHGVDISYHN